MATYESFTFSPTELSERYTLQTHIAINWLRENNYITEAQCEELLSRLIVTPIVNKPGWGSKILARMGFTSESEENSWTFPLVDLGKPKPTVEEIVKRKKTTK